jgi:transcriptional regulator with XRE-family HTH domain
MEPDMVKDINKKIGKRIAEFRKQSSLSQSELAEKTKLSTEYISRLERGVNAPSVKTLDILADVLDLSVRDFVTFSDTDDWTMEIEALIVLLKNKKGRSIRKIFKLSEVLDE